jgi:hypothetical protein
VLHMEPDLWGFTQRRSKDDAAATVKAVVGSSGLSELAGLPDTMAGFAAAVLRLRGIHAPNVLVGYHLSTWGTGVDIARADSPDDEAQRFARRAADYYRSLGADFDLVFNDIADRDAAFKEHVYKDGGASWWTADDFHAHATFLNEFVRQTRRPVVLWQLPLGNTKMRAMNNTTGHYQDNLVEWLLGAGSGPHLEEFQQAGVIALLFGGGAAGTTCACDAQGDGITNPAPIGPNTRDSLSADDDGGYFAERVRTYYAGGARKLAP